MEFISSEQFLKQPKEVQKVFINWWKPSEGDLVFVDFEYTKTIDIIINTDGKEMLGNIDAFNKEDIICPILTEGQLRKFIGDKTGDKIEINYHYNGEYTIDLFNQITSKYNRHYNLENISIDLLQAYWQVAVKIASEEISNE